MDATPTETAVEDRARVVPLPGNLDSVQPGGGFCYRVELAWGRFRRWYLRRFRAGYLKRMAERKSGSDDGSPFEILDPRDLKYVRNLCTADWSPADDPFHWREKIPLARWGLAEMQIFGWPLVVLSVVPTLAVPSFWWTGAIPLVVLLWLIYFFRDPPRRVPAGAGLLVAPADGKIVEIAKLENNEFVGGPAVRIGIFLSIFNVHINRAPSACRVVELRYLPGKFLNALRPESARENESLWIAVEETASPHRRLVVRQIAGAIARRIVCNLRPGEEISAGRQFGMIKFGSRAELILPVTDDLEIRVAIGQSVKAGATVLAQYTSV